MNVDSRSAPSSTPVDSAFRGTDMKHLKPNEAYEFLQKNPHAVMIDCRSEVEYLYVGHPLPSHHVAWNDGPDWDINPHFVGQVKKVTQSTDRPVGLICRSGQRSVAPGGGRRERGLAG